MNVSKNFGGKRWVDPRSARVRSRASIERRSEDMRDPSIEYVQARAVTLWDALVTTCVKRLAVDVTWPEKPQPPINIVHQILPLESWYHEKPMSLARRSMITSRVPVASIQAANVSISVS